MRIAGVVIAIVALLSGGCGGKDKPAAPQRTAYADSLAAVCAANVAALEQIGRTQSPEELKQKLPRQIAQYRAFHKQAKALRPPSYQKTGATGFVYAYGLWVYGEVVANRAIQADNMNGFFQLQDAALAWLRRSEDAARKLGAPECAVRPFDTTS
jgi:hypothetical protein